MTRIVVAGCGAVSPAGWGMKPFREALAKGESLLAKELVREGRKKPGQARTVPPPSPRPPFLAHPRVRRTSPIAQFTIAAALEALGEHAAAVSAGTLRLGVIVCVMSACVNYSRRFYDEALKDPSTASPLVFPETVFNAPASHIGAFLGTKAINYTLVGDPATFLQGLAVAADWLSSDRVDGCVVVGAEEADWLTAEAFALFEPDVVMGEGAGAVFLQRHAPTEVEVELTAITNAHLYTKHQSRDEAARKMQHEAVAASKLSSNPDSRDTPAGLLCDSLQKLSRHDAAERAAWAQWSYPRISVKTIFGEGLMAAAAWQCVAGINALQQNQTQEAVISVVGTNQQAIGAVFGNSTRSAANNHINARYGQGRAVPEPHLS